MTIFALLFACAVITKGFFVIHEKGQRVNRKFVDFHKEHELGEVKFGRN